MSSLETLIQIDTAAVPTVTQSAGAISYTFLGGSGGGNSSVDILSLDESQIVSTVSSEETFVYTPSTLVASPSVSNSTLEVSTAPSTSAEGVATHVGSAGTASSANSSTSATATVSQNGAYIGHKKNWKMGFGCSMVMLLSIFAV